MTDYFTLPHVDDETGMSPLARAALAHGLAEAEDDGNGHDRHHVALVLRTARQLAVAEGQDHDLDLVGIEAALHDVADVKTTGDALSGSRAARRFLLDCREQLLAEWAGRR